MFKKSFLCLVILSTLLCAGCLIKGRVVDQNGGVAGVTVTLSGVTSMTTTTDSNGDYQFGSLENLLIAGSYTVTPSGDFTPSSRNVTITRVVLDNGTAVPWPAEKVDFIRYTSDKGSWGVVCLPKTGQNICYNENGYEIPCGDTGQDGDIQAGVAWPSLRFTDNDDGTLTDQLTGLIWLKDANCSGEKTWFDAVTFCNSLKNGSYGLSDGSKAGDWRLPNIIELESLVNAQASNNASWLNSQGFSNVKFSWYWSASTLADDTTSAWLVDMDDCFLDSFVDSLDKSFYSLYVLPVRGGQDAPAQTWKTGQTISYAAGDDGEMERGAAWPSLRFTDNGDGTVTDHLTGLIWLKNANRTGQMTWNQALNFCNKLSSGSYGITDGSASGDWRLPNRKELLSLIDYSRTDPALPQGHPFINVQSSFYWSATTDAGLTSYAYVAHMYYGAVVACLSNSDQDCGSKWDYGYYVWPVRGGTVSTQPPLVGNLEISPSSYNFGTIGLKESASQEFTLRNTGTGDLTVQEIKISETPDFALILGTTSNPCITCPTIPPGGSCTLYVGFAPSEKGNSFANLIVTSNDPDSPTIEVPLSGTTLSHGMGCVVIIDGMDMWASILLPIGVNSETYLYDAINEGWRTVILQDVGPIIPFIWGGNADYTATAVHNLYERIKEYNSTYSRVVVLSHSWGTVLAYIALQKHADIHVDKLITLGSPLDSGFPGVSLYAKGWLEEANIYSVEKPSNLDVWNNYYAAHDPIAAKISSLTNEDNNLTTEKDYGGPFANHSCYYKDIENWNQILQDVINIE